MKPSNQVVHEGKKLKVMSKVTGVPTPEIAWFREGRPLRLREDTRYRIYDEPPTTPSGGAVSYFEIDNTSILDSGEYTCTASNMMGAVYGSISVTIEGI